MEKTDEVDRQLLVERHLISKQHAAGEGSRGVNISNDEGSRERVTATINNELTRLQKLENDLKTKIELSAKIVLIKQFDADFPVTAGIVKAPFRRPTQPGEPRALEFDRNTFIPRERSNASPDYASGVRNYAAAVAQRRRFT